ncbi:MAG: hypothetical protein R3287_09850 [Anderseniella sp.]|jgi:hypothetical protein|nr:hypothetical protein [Anderseniella sp.]
MQVLATALVAVGFCLVCAAVAGLGWAAWSGLTGDGWPVALPPPFALAGAGVAGTVAILTGRKLLA